MSFDIVKTVDFPQAAFQYVPQEILGGNAIEEFPTLGGILFDLKHLWNAKGPCLEVRNAASGRKVGSWIFGGILKDSKTKIIAVDELKRPHGRLSLLIVALECTISGGLVCVFDIFGSKVIRVVQVRDQIINIHVIDSGYENSVLPQPSPLRYFDGIVAVGTLGGNVYLLDICRQICENAIQNMDSTIRDELNPCPMIILDKENIVNIKKYVQESIDKEEHLALHLNVILNPSTEHFTLKGEKGEDRVHVNHSEAEVSSLFYSPQLASLLVGYNFGAFQLWDLRSLQLVYTSPICEGNIPVMHFTVQEPADDPKAYCYVWVSYSHNLILHSGLPFAVMYSFYYNRKNYINGYGNLFEEFQHCSVRFQIELGETEIGTYNSRVKGGICIGLQSINKHPINKEVNILSLCLVSWMTWNNHKEVNTSVLVFDLNQWYKEQMPRAPNWSNCSNYIIRNSLKNQVLDVKLDQKSLSQFIGIQRLEEHFCPTALSFDLWCITDNSILKVHNKGLQQAFIDKVVADQHLGMVRPEDYFEQITNLGLVPLFCDIHLSNSLDVDSQREILLNVALEQKLIGWLCKCTLKLANNAFNASGLTIYNILNWAFERSITLKNACDKYCVSLFDYSGTRLDNNTIVVLNSSTSQIRNICSLYRYISSKLMQFISDKDALLEEQRSLENVVVYFEVLLWMVNIGLLPECQQKNYRSYDDDNSTRAPYLVNDLMQYYNRKRAQLQMASHDTFVQKDCLLYIDNLINIKGAAEILRQQWQEDGGSGLYPPPSLQSVLRTYFLDGPDLVFKHSLVTYTLLDIAMTVDENNRIIKLLLKFPQIFDLSQSNIKIVQAFWHLDHDDYETALEYILDPCVLTEDLHRWHHSVMMRSLLLQDQSSLALLYLQIRKPSIQEEKDLLTVISLLISKNMLDEAFKFRQQHQNVNEQALLLHIFNECNKNEQLHSLLYRRLNNGEEKAFFKYLQNTKNPRCEDLKVFYYLLRSRFLEAFDSYSIIKRKKPENQGLIGQRDATTADNIIKMFKTLLPDINKNLVELVRKERTNLWKEVRKPTPLSVFVHNARDQVQYKSSIIFASLAKAKQTFNDTTINNDVLTEDTPFLRTPTVFRNGTSMGTPLMKSRVIEQNEEGEEFAPSPCKKLKLSPRTSKVSPARSRNMSLSTIQSKLSTPIIKRKRLSEETINTTAVLPQSILKGSSTSRTILDDSIFDENTSINTSLQLECENSIRRSRLALSPRKPVGRTPVKSHVKFQDLRYSDGSNEESSKIRNSLLPESSRRKSVDSTASTAEDVFYSPDSSPKDSDDSSQEFVEEKVKKSLTPVREKLNFEDTVTSEEVIIEDLPKKEGNVTTISVEENDLSTNRLTFQSPRSRRSYKRSLGDSPVPVRSSPRLARKASQKDEEDLSVSENTINKSEPIMKPSPSIAVQKVRGRKSLSRAVLENNTFSKLGSSHIFVPSPLENRFSLSLSDDTESEMDTDQSHNDSLEELLAKYKTSGLKADNSYNDSLISDSGENINEDGDVVSTSKEVRIIETFKESFRKTDTQELVSSKEMREETHSKKVFEQDDLLGLLVKQPVDSNVFKEITQDLTASTNEDIVEDDKKSEGEKSDILDNESISQDTNDKIEEREEINVYEDIVEDDKKSEGEKSDILDNESISQDTNDKIEEREEINVYEDLSSGSQDIKEVLLQFNKKKEDEEKVYDDISFSTSVSYYETEKKVEQMPENFMDSGESNSSNDNASKLPQPEQVYDNDVDMEEFYDDIPLSDRAFVGDGEVIEIGSSSDEDGNQKEDERETDESSQSSSSSSSEEKSYSSKDESNDNFNVNIGFEPNLEQTEDQAEKNYKSRPVGEENSRHNDDVGIQNALNQSSGSSLDDTSSNIEQQLELEQEEIAAAVKMMQADPLTEEQSVVMGDDEHMDSLILEDQSPENDLKDQLDSNIVAFNDENQDVVIKETQKVMEHGSVIKENLKDKEAIDETKELKVNDQKPQANEDIQVNTEESINSYKDLKQCNDVLIDSPGKDNTSIFLTPNESMDLKIQVVSEDDTATIADITEKDKSLSALKQSRGLQCTLGANDMKEPRLGDDISILQKDYGHIILDKDQVIAEEIAKAVDVTIRETSISPLKESKSIQCTLGVNNSLLVCSVDDTSVPLKGDITKERISPESDVENSNLAEKDTSVLKESKSLQCTLGANNSLTDSSINDTSVFLKDSDVLDVNNDGVPLSLMDTPKNEEGTPLVLKTVKKTYMGRKTSEVFRDVDLDATPKLAVRLTKRTYSKKDSSVNITSNVESSQTESQMVLNDKPQSEETEVTNEGDEPGVQMVVEQQIEDAEMNEKELANDKATEVVVEETKHEKPAVHMDIEQQNEDARTKDKELGDNKTLGRIKQSSPHQQDSQGTNNDNEAVDSDNSKSKNEEEAKSTPARMTRSMTLSQQDGSSSSMSDKSVGNNRGGKKSPEAKDKLEESPLDNASQLSISQTQSSKRVTRLSQLSDSLFDATFIPDSTVTRAEIDFMDNTIIDRSSKVRIEKDVMESLHEMEGKESPEGKPGPSRIRSRISSRGSTKNQPSTSKKHVPYLVSSTIPKKRTRSASVDQPPSTSIRKRSVRSKSIDLDNLNDPATESKMDLRVMLNPIPEHPGPSTERVVPEGEVPKHTTKAYSDVGTYTTSRRLTRRQASMLKSIGTVEEEIKKLPGVKEIDPLHLLAKEEFRGKPDPEESKVYERNSPSNSSETPSRHTRSGSVLSDVLSTPTKRKFKAKSEHVDSPATGIKTRLRRQSTDTMSITSEQSDSPSPSKRTKKKETGNEAESGSHSVRSTKRGRSRASSMSSTKSYASDESSIITTRSRRLQSTKSELSEIKEEKASDEGESVDTSVIKKRSRKKKN